MLKAHWNENIHYCTLKKRQNGFYNFCIEGGSDNGQLIVLGSLLAEPVEGKAIPGSVILEINQIKISGCTQSDVQLMVDRYDTLLLTLTFPGQTYFDPDDVLTTDIRAFLSNTFYVNSPEEYLQQTIRANLFRKVSLVTTDSECIKTKRKLALQLGSLRRFSRYGSKRRTFRSCLH
ncbi:Membrane-associated guanylate kinase, WW and PDZ domain-containing protein 3 [Thelohanellus kitauei]|uniref:Membrane-associated guanylate kinase, WW and PDZ domain-containing protein 3 n=1 Tax=Thelohanellus kitauei TaxID=669202 RepID=A0A0C2IH67_THEKT|nr:Membrane-associated guanylate kinase, WW and PDZ domain-containing protein 3 [Thelohanellus kitauei]